MPLVLALHAVVALVAGLLARRIGARALLVAGVAPVGTCVLAALNTANAIDGDAPRTWTVEWVSGLDLSVSLSVDAFGVLMLWLVGGIGVLVCWFGWAYFGHGHRALGGFTASLVFFAGAMAGLVTAADVWALFLFWELTSVASFLLIGAEDRDPVARAAALQAFLVTALGGIALLGGFVLLADAAGTTAIAGIVDAAPRGGVVPAALALVLVGAATKSAQFPFQFWLPGAMAAPTPVSAYLHSATMVKAGVVLVARLAPGFATAPGWRPATIALGGTTMLLGGVLALRRTDLKQLLAYGTISQLGLLVLLFGVGIPKVTGGAVAVLLAHAVYKAALFMVVGIVDHQAHTRDLRALDGLGRRMPGLAAVAALAAASMAAIPPLLGFAAKELSLAALMDSHESWAWIPVGIVVVGSVLTVVYAGRFWFGTFGAASPAAGVDVVSGAEVARPRAWFVGPPAVLAAASLVLGLAPGIVAPLVRAATQGLWGGDVETKALVAWPGWTDALVVSLAVLVAGAAAVGLRRRVDPALARLPHGPSGERAYGGVISGLLRVSERVTASIQVGSLPVYLAVILTVAMVLPLMALLVGERPRIGDLPFAENAVQGLVASLVVVAAFAVAVLQTRFAAALALGAVGSGVAVLFVIKGGPDLALTQVLVEMTVLVGFVVVLALLPRQFGRARADRRFERTRRASQVLVAGLVGTVVTVLLLVASGAREHGGPSEYLARALTDAGGRNVVNTILVDFRGFDTLGEIMVLVVVALGIIGLTRPEREVRPPGAGSFSTVSMVAAAGRIAVYPVLTLGVYLLFAGHNQPGGGFVGGLVVGAALVVRFLTLHQGRPLGRVRPEVLAGVGLALAVGTGIAGWAIGDAFLESGSVTLDVPVLGTAKAYSVLAFDVGVFLIVVGMVATMLDRLGRRSLRLASRRPATRSSGDAPGRTAAREIAP